MGLERGEGCGGNTRLFIICSLFISLFSMGKIIVCLLTDGNELAWGEQLMSN